MSDVASTTPRLAVGRWRQSDLDAVLAVYGDADAMRWVGDGRAISMSECERRLDATIANYRRHGYAMFALESLSDNFVIVHPAGQRDPEIKFAIRRFLLG